MAYGLNKEAILTAGWIFSTAAKPAAAAPAKKTPAKKAPAKKEESSSEEESSSDEEAPVAGKKVCHRFFFASIATWNYYKSDWLEVLDTERAFLSFYRKTYSVA